MGVFARGWLGLGVCAAARVRCGVFACLRVFAWGWWDSVVPPPPLPRFACLRARALVWALLVCARLLRCGSNGNGAGQSLSRPVQRGAAPVALCAREGLGGAPRGVLTRARTRGEGDRWEGAS